MKRRIQLRRVPEREAIESLNLHVPDLNAADEYIRIGPSHPLYHGEVAKRMAQAARDGDTDAAREILEDFVGAMADRSDRVWESIGPPVHWVYARYIADAFEKILSGADPALALGIKNSKPGRRKGKTTHNEDALAAAFNLLIINGLKPKQAKLALKARTGADVRTIEKANTAHFAYQIWARQALRRNESKADREHATEIVKVGAEPYREHVSAILRGTSAATSEKK